MSRIKNAHQWGTETIMAYDEAGNQRLLSDPNAGITTYIYNAFGELVEQTDAKNNVTNMYYDSFGRLEGKEITNGETGAFEKTAYSYQGRPDVGGFGKLRRILGNNGIEYGYAYDEISRLLTKTETIDGIDYAHNYTYDPYYDKIMTLEYPSGFKVKYDYLPNGFLDKIKDNSTNNMLWQPTYNNGRGQLTDYNLGNGLSTHKEFDIYGYPEAIRTTKDPATIVQNLEYDFERATGNLLWRKDVRPGNDLYENFGYDTEMLNSRLTSWQARFQQEYSIIYKPNGNIFTKSDVTIGGPLSVYLYGNDAGANAVTTVHNPTNEYLAEASNPQSITYTLFNKTETITQTKIEEEEEHRYGLSYTYGLDNARKTAVTTKDRRVLKTKTYIGADYEVENLEDGSIRKLHYITGGDGLFAIYVWKSSDIGEPFEKRMYYIHKDYLGSYETITNNSGIILEKLSFDPWGRKRNPVDWTYTPSPYQKLFDRGYTGHEHLEAFGLINMNGRVYDPWLGRMLSPDNYVQAPTYSQNFNRYSYCLNNPLKYTDPSGEYFFVLPNVSWSAQGGLSFGIMAGVGIPGGLSAQVGIGYNVTSNDPYAFVGGSFAFNTVYASLSGSSGFSVGYTAGLTMFSGVPISSNAFTVGVNYNITHNSWSGNVSSWTAGQGGWAFNPSVSAMVLPEETTNLVRGQGFRNNGQVLGRFVNNNDHNGALEYFGFEGGYQQEKPAGAEYVLDKNGEYYGATNPTTGEVSYGNAAFSSYDNLYATATKEQFTSMRVKNGVNLATSSDFASMKYYPEEALGFRAAFRLRRLYPKSTIKHRNQANAYWGQVYGEVLINDRISCTFFNFRTLW